MSDGSGGGSSGTVTYTVPHGTTIISPMIYGCGGGGSGGPGWAGAATEAVGYGTSIPFTLHPGDIVELSFGIGAPLRGVPTVSEPQQDAPPETPTPPLWRQTVWQWLRHLFVKPTETEKALAALRARKHVNDSWA